MGNAISSLLNKTVAGWLLIVVITSIGGYRYYLDQQKKANKQNARSKGREVQGNQPKKDNKAKKQRVESFASQNKAQPKSYATAVTSVPTPETKAAPSKSRDEVDDRAFAQQMANNKQNKFATKTTSEQKHKQKSVKQSKAKEINEVNKVTEHDEVGKESAPSSNAGADADDDQSPITSPSVGAADSTGVSDMLEQTSTGPTVLRLTGTEEKPKKAKKTKTPEPTETKKQRQNRQKRELEKAEKEEAEKLRKVAEEAQRRTARLAEGRPAKDGSGFAAAQKANAWAGKAGNGTSANTVHAPLDTFENPSKTAGAPATTNGHENKENVKQSGNWAENPYTEEQQLKMFEAEDDSKWQSVETKKAKKAKKTPAGVASSEDGSANEAPAPAVAPAAAISSASKSKAAVPNGRPKAQPVNSFDALAVQDAGSEEEQAQEWDV
ncbi:hypothetical protein N0V93_003585 [Gnomoniopsis smithogilvyi]|uniref:Uncharacterized protein n=1 Tax=Gnomoniopsis smithogilvyi TaxID=1191159 RepID=A0A9W8YZI3_9PEZI|nr:hypothetical protein N0V93_003585 [Gnomoniopsis smithogilvyi]